MQAATSLQDSLGEHPQKLSDNIAVWSEMKDLMVKYNCLSLGEGAPNLMPPQFLIDDMTAAMQAGHNQYTRTFGVPALVNKIAAVYGPKLGREINAMKEVLVTQGANGALCAFINAFCNKGEQVVSFEPMFPLYLDHAEFCGGSMLGVPLNLVDGIWKFDPEQLRAALSKPTSKVFVFNTPHNPTGKVFTVEEMQQISDILDDCPHVLVLSDEVYDFATFDGRTHTSFATVGNNWDRTISIFSGGKLFNATGWKIGWTIGPEKLIHHGCIIANTVFYCFNTPGQVAVATSLDRHEKPGYNEAGNSFVEDTRALFESNRDFLKQSLTEMAMPWTPVLVEGGYFLMADITACVDLIPEKYKTTHEYEPEDGRAPIAKYRLNMPDGRIPLDLAFCRWMAIEKGVTMMPNSFFYHKSSPTMNDQYVRLAICKDRQSTEAAAARLRTALD
mmetsp:Transcript_24840/g.33252  ORF Transcript_24840/g.33252 Transcript_24840/m.33252 type:complete len:445 (+) Transcript_24840:43-1377(+)|eukprot:CAMPEP_0185580252 /NCGR_PEP_ID=MMETSP0434-20130131/15875_1 /TAXON_ID=626734 ORGANISM="Favella taraikaensis, Strain Fe Narragansett Bay" /NCGR_SAMPLE_ID=MMETSP0434 /ASSEMBLY_ACC=CAM_ASM_000379 /LENGTH=444 /DNA_ID=CAMNT_0028198467 /DNA_START=37 /DNA_END=1371 /DNA_ORIENTATION=-